MNKFTVLAILAIAFTSGFFAGLAFNFADVSVSNFDKGRNSALQASVDIRTDLCGHVTIPLEVLASMVNAGIMDWQKACMEKVTP